MKSINSHRSLINDRKSSGPKFDSKETPDVEEISEFLCSSYDNENSIACLENSLLIIWRIGKFSARFRIFKAVIEDEMLQLAYGVVFLVP